MGTASSQEKPKNRRERLWDDLEQKYKDHPVTFLLCVIGISLAVLLLGLVLILTTGVPAYGPTVFPWFG